jgi:choline kinase
MKAILLAAGASRRLMPLTKNLPKCLIQIGGESILEHQLNAILWAGIREVVIVIGYLKEKIKEFIGTLYRDTIRISYIENQEFRTTNTIYSLYLAREEFLDQDFLYFNADVLMHPDIVKGIIMHEGQNVLAVDYVKCGEEEVKFATNADNRIIKLGKDIAHDRAEGEFIGVAKFGKDITQYFIDALTLHCSKGKKDLFFERAVEDILNRAPFHPLDVSHIPKIEIDFPEDLKIAEEIIYPAIQAYEQSPYESSK